MESICTCHVGRHFSWQGVKFSSTCWLDHSNVVLVASVLFCNRKFPHSLRSACMKLRDYKYWRTPDTSHGERRRGNGEHRHEIRSYWFIRRAGVSPELPVPRFFKYSVDHDNIHSSLEVSKYAAANTCVAATQPGLVQRLRHSYIVPYNEIHYNPNEPIIHHLQIIEFYRIYSSCCYILISW